MVMPAPIAQNVTDRSADGKRSDRDIWEQYSKGEVLGRVREPLCLRLCGQPRSVESHAYPAAALARSTAHAQHHARYLKRHRAADVQGAFGIVYEATDKATGRKRAVKTISKAKLVSKEDVADVQREMQVGSANLVYHLRFLRSCLSVGHDHADVHVHPQILLLVGDHRHVAALKDTFEDHEYVRLHLIFCQRMQ